MRKRVVVPAFMLAAAACAHAIQLEGGVQDVASEQRYRAPDGFQDHKWGEPLASFAHFEPDPVYVQTAMSKGKTTLIDMQCVSRSGNGCDLDASLRTAQQKIEGEGAHVLAEYYVASQGVQFEATGAVLFPVLYQFCASWSALQLRVPENIQERMKFCGMRMLFRSETADELRARAPGDDRPTTYDRILQELIRLHGEPEHYSKRGHVIIHTPDETIADPGERRFNEWRWCSLHGDRDIAPRCVASVVFAFDARTGWGIVLYATRPVWEFAYARHEGGAENDPLYQLLRGLDLYHPADISCTGSNLCRPGPPRRMRDATKAQFRLRASGPSADQ